MKHKVKTIGLRVNGEIVHEFKVYDVELKLAKRLGISERSYITEKSKLILKELKNVTSNR